MKKYYVAPLSEGVKFGSLMQDYDGALSLGDMNPVSISKEEFNGGGN